jgi:regulator of PEP synthase PpsR (kinase-PPPase family)
MSNIEYFARIEAIEYTLAHDDGLQSDRLSKADIILTGVSRSGKTPLSVYLAMFGWKVANVPLVKGIDPPDELFKVDPNRVFGLDIMINYLIAQRGNRVKSLKMAEDSDYITPRMVRDELDYALYIFRKGGFTVIDITNKPIESSANEILSILTSRFSREDWKKDLLL